MLTNRYIIKEIREDKRSIILKRSKLVSVLLYVGFNSILEET
jgi:hypothetical protein